MITDIKKIVCDVIAHTTVIKDGIYQLDETDNLLEAGLDSFQLMKVIVELEIRFNIKFRDEDLIIIRFHNLREICLSIQEVLKNYDIS